MAKTLDDELLSILADPETHEPVVAADDAQLAKLREAIGLGRAKARSGETPGDFEGALLSQGGKVAYLVSDGIPNMLIDDRVELDEPL